MTIADNFAATPAPPYYVVTFTSQHSDDDDGYAAIAARMVELAARQPGYLGIESVRDASGFGITLSYWTSLDAITAWKRNAEHLEAQRRGRAGWYKRFELRVARVEKAYGKR